jgi:Na+:H+ antiporter, NhaA family
LIIAIERRLRTSHALSFGVSLLGGIGFTMSIFIADLGFADAPQDLLMAKTGILMASAIAGFGGYFWLRMHTTKPDKELH